MAAETAYPGPAHVTYFTQAQAGAWGEMLAAFAAFLGPLAGARVVDVGSGPGLLPRLCREAGAALALALDESWPMARRAAELARGQDGLATVAARALQLPLAGAACDVATATNLLFLLDDPAAGLAELARVARPGGTVALLNPADGMSVAAAEAFADSRGLQGFARFSFVNYGRLAEAHHRLSPAAWLALAGRAGLADLRSQTRADGLVVFVSGRRL